MSILSEDMFAALGQIRLDGQRAGAYLHQLLKLHPRCAENVFFLADGGLHRAEPGKYGPVSHVPLTGRLPADAVALHITYAQNTWALAKIEQRLPTEYDPDDDPDAVWHAEFVCSTMARGEADLVPLCRAAEAFVPRHERIQSHEFIPPDDGPSAAQSAEHVLCAVETLLNRRARIFHGANAA